MARADTSPSRIILVIDADRQAARLVRRVIAPLGAQVDTAGTGAAAIALAARLRPDLVIMELSLPDLDGLELCQRVRSLIMAPIIVLSERGSEQDKVALLLAGADDYITKPFGAQELEARVRVQLRRVTGPRAAAAAVIEVGTFRIDLLAPRLMRGHTEIHLTVIEWKIMSALSARRGEPVSCDALVRAVWGQSPDKKMRRCLRVHIANLRRKLDANTRLIRSQPGIGYRLPVGGRNADV